MLFAAGASVAHAQAEPDPDADLLAVTCGEFLSTLTTANPGTAPTAERTADAAAAQQNAFKAIIWAHGYNAGKHGVDPKTALLNRAWVVKKVPQLATQCRKNSKASLYSAVEAVDAQ